MQVGPVHIVIIGAVGGLVGQVDHAVEHVLDLLHGALGGLHQGDTVLHVLLGGVQAGDLGTHLLGNGEACGVVASPVDLIAGAELFQVAGEGGGVVGVVAVGVHRHNIVSGPLVVGGPFAPRRPVMARRPPRPPLHGHG